MNFKKKERERWRVGAGSRQIEFRQWKEDKRERARPLLSDSLDGDFLSILIRYFGNRMTKSISVSIPPGPEYKNT